MKALFSKILILAAASVLLWSCEKDELKATLKSGVAPALTTTQTAPLVLTQANEKQQAVEFTWNAVDYGYSDAIQYVLQIAKSGTGFASASTTEVGVTKKDGKKAFTVAELNAELNKILPTGVASDIDVRPKADAAGIVSNTLKLNVTPYRVLVAYSYPAAINVAGNFQGWAPATAPQLVSVGNDGKYVGFIDFSAAPAPAFKFVKGNDWSFGDFGSAGAGLIGNGGSDLQLSSAGVYKVEVNTTNNTWSSYKVDGWGLIGNAIPGTGWNSDVDLTYNAASKTYSVTLDLVPGEIKFRANDDWKVDLGDNSPADGRPELGGNNIKIQTAGNYTITLDILVGGNWFYMIKKN